LTFSSVLVLQVTLYLASHVNPAVRQGVDFLLVPILALFVFSIFWRSVVQTFLSFAGTLITYGGVFFFYTVNGSSQLVSTYVANRLGYGIKHIAMIAPSSVADRCFIMGIFALTFCLAYLLPPITIVMYLNFAINCCSAKVSSALSGISLVVRGLPLFKILLIIPHWIRRMSRSFSLKKFGLMAYLVSPYE